MARADAGRVKAASRRVVACAIRALATRGHHRGHAALTFWRRSATERRRQLIQSCEYCNDDNFVTEGFQRKLSTSRLKSNVLATTFVQGSCSNSQPKLRKITPNIGLSDCQSIKDLENSLSVESLILLVFVGPIQAC